METQERLYRSQTDKVFGGVAGGLANYFDIDVVLARVAFVLLALFGGSGGLIYIILWIVIPKQPLGYSTYENRNENKQATESGPDNNQDNVEVIYENKPAKHSNTGLVAGVILIFLGILFLGDRLFPWYNLADLWPLLLVVVGVIIIKPDIFKPSKKQNHEI